MAPKEVKKKKKRAKEQAREQSAKARLERMRVRASARRYRDLGLCDRECAALAIATELVVSESNFAFTPTFARSLDSSVDDDDDDDDDTERGRFRFFFPTPGPVVARFLLRGATRFETFLVFARLGAKLRDAGGSSFLRAKKSIFAAPRATKIDRDRRPASETLVRIGTRRKENKKNKKSEGLRFGVLAVAVVAAALAAAARALGRRGAWRAAAAAAAAAAARSAATAARVTRE